MSRFRDRRGISGVTSTTDRYAVQDLPVPELPTTGIRLPDPSEIRTLLVTTFGVNFRIADVEMSDISEL
jgi:hypothetical protein